MSKSNELIITSESPEAMVAAFQEVMPHLQKDVRRQLVHLSSNDLICFQLQNQNPVKHSDYHPEA